MNTIRRPDEKDHDLLRHNLKRFSSRLRPPPRQDVLNHSTHFPKEPQIKPQFSEVVLRYFVGLLSYGQKKSSWHSSRSSSGPHQLCSKETRHGAVKYIELVLCKRNATMYCHSHVSSFLLFIEKVSNQPSRRRAPMMMRLVLRICLSHCMSGCGAARVARTYSVGK